MKYNPKRDIPKACRELKTLSPTEVSKWIQEHRTEKDPKTGKRRQVLRTPESVTMFFTRNPKVYQELNSEIEDVVIEAQAIDERLFENGNFRKIPVVEQMIIDMRGRGAKERSIDSVLSILKRVCMGQLPRTKEQRTNKEPEKYIEGWGLKHPKRLTVEDCLKFNSEMIKNKSGSRDWRLALRCFLKSRGLRGWDKLSGRYSGAGKYAHIYAPNMNPIFEWLKEMNKEAHDACYFAYKTGCRTGATLGAESKYVDRESRRIWVFEKASKHQEGKRKLKKTIPPDLWELLKPRVERGGKLFDINEETINGLLKACYQETIPQLAEEVPMPFHFFRHQFAQHGLRATGWNTSLIAKLGGWTVGTLERYYGKMDEQTAFKEAEKFLGQM